MWAAVSSSPIARRCRPNRVLVTQAAASQSTTSAAIEVGTPKSLLRNSDNAGGTSPPGLGSIRRATPCQTDIEPSVTTIGGNAKRTTSAPLQKPAAAPTSSATAKPVVKSRVSRSAAQLPATLEIGPSDRSIPPVSTTKNWPKEISTSGRALAQSVCRSKRENRPFSATSSSEQGGEGEDRPVLLEPEPAKPRAAHRPLRARARPARSPPR